MAPFIHDIAGYIVVSLLVGTILALAIRPTALIALIVVGILSTTWFALTSP